MRDEKTQKQQRLANRLPISRKEYKPTPREQEVIKAFVASREARKLSSRLKVTKAASGAFNIGIDHKDPLTGQMLLMQALGVTDFDFAAGI